MASSSRNSKWLPEESVNEMEEDTEDVDLNDGFSTDDSSSESEDEEDSDVTDTS